MGLIDSLFGKSKERETIEYVKEHIGHVYDTVASLKDVFNALEKGDEAGLEDSRAKVDSIEKKADDARRRIEEELYSGAFLPVSRGRLINFVDEVDWVADTAQDASRMTEFLAKEKIGPELMTTLKEMLDSSVECVGYLSDAVNELGESEKMIEAIRKVNEIEQEIDLMENKAFHLLYDREYSPRNMILLSKLIEFIGEVSNKAEDASDKLSLINLMYKP